MMGNWYTDNKSDYLKVLIWSLLSFPLLSSVSAEGLQNSDRADDIRVYPVSSKKSLIITDVYVYGGWANIRQNAQTNSSCLDVGIGTEFYKKFLRFGLDVGYKYNRYDYNKGLFRNSGLLTHWITCDASLSYTYFCIGFRSDVFLTSHLYDTFPFEYQESYNNCFNHASFCGYVGAKYRLSFLKLEIRMGGFIIPFLASSTRRDKTKAITGSQDRFYWEVRASFRIFTTGRRMRSFGNIE